MRLSILISFFVAVLGWAADDLTVYHTKFRQADELLATAKPLFFGKATFSTLNDKIVISAPASTTAAVLKLFAELDRAPRRFRISTRLVTRGSSSQQATGVGIDVKGKRGYLSQRPGASSRTAGRISAGGITVEGEQIDEARSATTAQTIEAIEGGQATLFAGSSWHPGGVVAKVKGAGKNVNVELRQRESANPALSLQTELTMPLGVWRPVGNVFETGRNDKGKILGGSKGSQTSAKELQLRIDESR